MKQLLRLQILWKKIHRAISDSEVRLWYGAAGAIALLAVVFLVWFLFQAKTWRYDVPEEVNTAVSEYIECARRDNLSGVCLKQEEGRAGHVVAVMIENHPSARPQAGLSRAAVVYEVPVEGQYTRFLVLFSASTTVPKAGPVRSVRPYYLDWLAEYGTPLYMHVGGSPDALARIEKTDVNDLNEFYRGWFYWRDNKRDAPHNVYTSSELWQKALSDYMGRYTKQSFDSWVFGDTAQCENGCVSHITIRYAEEFEAGWRYNTSTQKYERWQSGAPHRDDDARQIMADTVIVQDVTTTVLDNVGRLGMETQGSGKVEVFAKGGHITGRWEKNSVTSRTRWLDASGSEIVLQPGKIWVQVANQHTDVSFE